MDKQETAALLALMAARDGRHIGQVEVEAWHEDIARWDFTTAREAVSRHYSRTREFMRPFDLIKAIREIRAERLDAAGHLVPPAELADDPAGQITWMRSHREAIASGLVPPQREAPLALVAEPEDVAEMRRALTDGMRVPDRDGTRESGREAPGATVDPAAAEAAEGERRRQMAALAAMGGAP